MGEPVWISRAKQGLGQKEIPGPAENSWITNLWKRIKLGGIKTEDVPWCAAFVGATLEDCCISSTRADSAASYLRWGQPLPLPTIGCVVVFSRPGGNHVAFVLGKDVNGRLVCIGGNQGNAVSIASFDRARALAYRWPGNEPKPVLASLPLLTSAGVSVSEA